MPQVNEFSWFNLISFLFIFFSVILINIFFLVSKFTKFNLPFLKSSSFFYFL